MSNCKNSLTRNQPLGSNYAPIQKVSQLWRSQFVPQQGVPVAGRRQLFECRLWRVDFELRHGRLRVHTVLRLDSRVGPVVEFAVKLARVEVLEELQHAPRLVAVLVLGEQVHVAERVDRDQRQVARRLAQVVQRVRELLAVGSQEIDVFYKNMKIEFFIIASGMA
jgi:hypothetical protein